MNENDDFKLIEKNLNSSREQMVKFEQNLKTLNAIQQTKKKLRLIKKFKSFCDGISKSSPYELVVQIHFILFFIAFVIHVTSLNLEKRRKNDKKQLNFLKKPT